MTPSQHPEIVDPLAAEYALGTLRGRARARFEKWRSTTPAVQERCRFWEEQLMYLADDLRPVRPPDRVWEVIRSRLGLPPPGSQAHPEFVSTDRVRPVRQGRLLGIAASLLLAVGVGGLLYWRAESPGPLASTATVTTPAGQQLWDVEVYSRKGRIVMRAGPDVSRPSGHDYELWALPAGGKPVSLGVMPASGSGQHELTTEQKMALAASTQVAVTLETAGGSASGQPTSKPIFVVPLHSVG